MEKADITIIGAGVVGLAVAACVSRPERSVFIVEKNPAPGGGISSRNSEVIHAGIYYPEGSLKARLCVSGCRMLYDIAGRHGIPHQKTGKLIVAAHAGDADGLERLYEQGKQNGALSLAMISKEKIARMEPNIKAEAALFSPGTGIISAHHLMNYYLAKAQAGSARLVTHTQVTDMERDENGWRIFTQNDRGEKYSFSSAVVINCAGLESDTVARMIGGEYRLHYCKGDYCGISGVKPGMVSRLIYPAPPKNHVGLGVHLTMDLNGRMKLGPDAVYTDRAENYNVSREKAALFYDQARQFLPFLKPEHVTPDMAGIRPKLQGPEDAFADFAIRLDAPGFINLVGIESPGLTASPAIAQYVKDLLFH